ncbi:MAG: Rrf2 family transcriptional regulator [Candidatus Omnitrophota bacterium]
MKMITKDTDYAIKALACIAVSPEETVTVKGLSEKLGIPGPFLRKILQVLNKKGILVSSKGKNGGFSAASSPLEMTVLDIIEIFQGPFKLNEHKIKNTKCKFLKTCRLRNKIDNIGHKVKEELKAITIGSLI